MLGQPPGIDPPMDDDEHDVTFVHTVQDAIALLLLLI